MALKTIAIATIIAVGGMGGFVLIRLTAARQGERWLTWGSAFSGGIFLSAGLLHLLVDASEHMEK